MNADFAEAVTYAKQFESVRPIVDFRISDYENEQAERRKESETASSSFIEEVLHIPSTWTSASCGKRMSKE